MRVSRVIAVTAVSVLVLAAPAWASPSATGRQIAACMRDAAATLAYSGTAYARRGDLVVERSFGASDAAAAVPNDGRTRFNIGSVNKMFTAIAIGQLIDQGVLRLDAPIVRYLPGLAPAFADITLAELLDHTSGLGDYFQPQNRAAIEAAKTATDLLPLALASPPAFRPGAKRAYSNSGFVVLGAVIETVSGKTWASFVEKQILDPAGMADTRFELVRRRHADEPDVPSGHAGNSATCPGAGIGLARGRHVQHAVGLVPAPGRPVRRTAGEQGDTCRAAHGSTRPGGRAGNLRLRVRHPGNAAHQDRDRGRRPGVNADIADFPQSGWRLIALANIDPPGATAMNKVLEQAIFSDNPATACAAALADPRLRSPPAVLVTPVAGRDAPVRLPPGGAGQGSHAQQ